jgi:hypothetical protein
VAYSPDGKHILTDDYGINTAKVWDAVTGKVLLSLERHSEGVTSVAYSPNGKSILSGSWDKTAKVWDAATGKLRFTLEGHSEWVSSVAYSPDGKHILTGSGDRTAKVWDAATGKLRLTLEGHLNRVNSVAYSPDGKSILTGSHDGTIRFWNALSGRELARLVGVDSDDWLVCTPEGYFDGSEGGRDNVNYRIPGTGQVVPVSRFFQDFYRPGLLPLALAGKLDKPTVDLAGSLPPSLRFATPNGDRVVKDRVLDLTLEAQDNGGGVRGPFLYCNGANLSTFASGESTTVGKKVVRRFRIELAPGVNVLQARASSRNGAWDSAPVSLRMSSGQAVVKSVLHLVLIGVSDYPDPGGRLRSPVNDVKQVEALFRRRHAALYRDIKLYRLLDTQATAKAIRASLKKAAAAAEPGDTLMVFAAGHGVTLGQRYFFLSHDFDSRKVDSTEVAVKKGGVPADVIAEDMASSRCLKRVLVLDTCAAGGAVAALLRAAGPGRGEPDFRKQIEWLSMSQGIWVIAGAATSEEAREPRELKLGLLTYMLLAGLNAVSHGPLANEPLRLPGGRTTVTVSEWGDYARLHLSPLADRAVLTQRDRQRQQWGVGGLAGDSPQCS